MWFWNNQSDDTKPILGQWLGVSHRVGSAICYWILSEKGKVLSRTTVQNITPEEQGDLDFQERIRDYHGSLEDALGSEELGTSLDGYDFFIDDNEEGIYKGDPNKEGYQGPPDYPEIDEIIYNSDEERSTISYDQYIGAGFLIPDRKGERLMEKVEKCVRYDDTSTGEGNYNTMHDKSLYEVEYPDGTTEQLAANIISENMLSQADSEIHHYQVLIEVTYHKKDDIAISKVDGFINSSSGKLH